MIFGSLDWYLDVGHTIDVLYQEELGRAPDDSGRLNLLWHAREHGWTGGDMRIFLHDSEEGIAHRTTPPAPTVAPLPAAKTRDQACQVRTSFNGQLVYELSTGTYRDVLLWSPEVSDEDRQRTIRTHLGGGDTHIVCNISAMYHPAQRLPIAGSGWDFTGNLPLFKARLRELIVSGLTPLCALAGDGQVYNPEGGTYGWDWLMKNLPRLSAALKGLPDSECPDGEDFITTRLMVPFMGFELVEGAGGNWTPDQFFQAHVRAREVFGPEAVIAAEIGTYAWPGEGSATRGQADVVMSSDAMLAIDVMLAEWQNPGDPERQDGIEQIASRWLGPKAKNIQPKNKGPWYLAKETPRGPRYAVAFERCLYLAVRNQITPAQVNEDAELFRRVGWELVC